ncbi:hypothetical protein X980_6226 [Burkholderia pseudomallei MSHR4000]|nr:hypothetical protein JT30_5831 [Burkholderia pseudomallei]KGW18982.1 hypothetical protein X980_6226 [Burkholderia pseudomallei MSHR4000]
MAARRWAGTRRSGSGCGERVGRAGSARSGGGRCPVVRCGDWEGGDDSEGWDGGRGAGRRYSQPLGRAERLAAAENEARRPLMIGGRDCDRGAYFHRGVECVDGVAQSRALALRRAASIVSIMSEVAEASEASEASEVSEASEASEALEASAALEASEAPKR